MIVALKGADQETPHPVPLRGTTPHGEGCGLLGAPPRTSMIALSRGERGNRQAVSEVSSCNAWHAQESYFRSSQTSTATSSSRLERRDPQKSYFRSSQTSTATPAKPGDLPTGSGLTARGISYDSKTLRLRLPTNFSICNLLACKPRGAAARCIQTFLYEGGMENVGPFVVLSSRRSGTSG
jgi:hypothetical protein